MSGTRIEAVFETDNDDFYLLRTFMFTIAECKTEIYLDENLKPKRNLYAIDHLEGPEPLLSLTKSLVKSGFLNLARNGTTDGMKIINIEYK